MKILATSSFLFAFQFLHCQKLQELKPVKTEAISTDFSQEFINHYNSKESLETCEEIWKKMRAENLSIKDLKLNEQQALDLCDELGGDPWSMKYSGCSWYCGGQIDDVHSNIGEDNISKVNDFNYGTASKFKTANTENFVEFIFNPKSSRITNIIIINGDVRNKGSFGKSGRVKKLMMFLDNSPFAVLNLEDTSAEQIFEFKPLGHKKKKGEPVKQKQWKIKFEIVEVYDNSQDEVAISEIYFDGDGHEGE